MSAEIRVLHVDDDLEFAELTGTHLERENDRFTVETAPSAGEGLARLGDGIDCVLSDYEMPGMDGIEFLTRFREEYPDRPFFLYTGKGNEDVASEAISAGVTDYLTKATGTEQHELLATRIETAVEQYRTERELERQNDLFAKTRDLADAGAWEYDPQADEVFLTDEVYEIYGVGADYDPSPEKDIDRFYHPEDRDTVREAITAALESGEDYDIEVRIITPDGTEKWVRTRATPETEDGTVTRVRGTFQEITDRKERELELQRQKERLEDVVSVLSHDIRNPLQVAQVRLDVAREQSDSDHLATVAESLDRIETLVMETLKMARQGQRITESEPVALAGVVRDSREMVGIDESAVTVVEDFTVDGDRGRLQQLLENLFSNAVEHGSTSSRAQPGDAVEHGGDDVSITVGRMEGGFYVADDGVGIPERDRENCFEIGYSASEQGTGFGLHIVEQIVTAHGWEIRVTESEDGGARFEITGVESLRR